MATSATSTTRNSHQQSRVRNMQQHDWEVLVQAPSAPSDKITDKIKKNGSAQEHSNSQQQSNIPPSPKPKRIKQISQILPKNICRHSQINLHFQSDDENHGYHLKNNKNNSSNKSSRRSRKKLEVSLSKEKINNLKQRSVSQKSSKKIKLSLMKNESIRKINSFMMVDEDERECRRIRDPCLATELDENCSSALDNENINGPLKQQKQFPIIKRIIKLSKLRC